MKLTKIKVPPLHFAGRFSTSPEVVKMLFVAGGMINALDNLGSTPLMCAVSVSSISLQMLGKDNTAVMKALVKAGANMSVYDSSGIPLLANCVIQMQGEQGDLMHSTLAHLRALIELGADVDTRAKTDKGETALMLAVFLTLQPEVIEILTGSTKDINMKSFDGVSAYSLALGTDNPAALANKDVRLNLENNKAAISILEANGAKISFPDLCSCVSAERVKKAIISGANVNEETEKGVTPLKSAIAMNPDSNVFIELLKAGADINITDTHGYTPFDVAVEMENYGAAEIIESLCGKANIYRM